MHIFDAIALQRAEIIRIAEFLAQLLEDRPIAVMGVFAIFPLQIIAEVLGDAVIVDQRVVDVEQKTDVGHLGHAPILHVVPAGGKRYNSVTHLALGSKP